MLKETIDYLNIKEDGVYVDCTLGGAGHALYLINQLGDKGRLIAIDQDTTAIENAKEVLKDHLHKVTFVHNNFRKLTEILNDLNIEKVDGIYYDLGVSSPQLDVPERGFSYHHNAKLDMRMDQSQSLSAHEVVNDWEFEKLVKIFQAIRIAVNDELSSFEDSLDQAIDLVKVDGRISVITFHSLEDRLCKQMFQEYEKGPDVPRGLPVIPEAYTPKLKRVNRKPITATDEDLENNNRARSAKLRVAEILK